jgi:hypothetical protein
VDDGARPEHEREPDPEGGPQQDTAAGRGDVAPRSEAGDDRGQDEAAQELDEELARRRRGAGGAAAAVLTAAVLTAASCRPRTA